MCAVIVNRHAKLTIRNASRYVLWFQCSVSDPLLSSSNPVYGGESCSAAGGSGVAETGTPRQTHPNTPGIKRISDASSQGWLWPSFLGENTFIYLMKRYIRLLDTITFNNTSSDSASRKIEVNVLWLSRTFSHVEAVLSPDLAPMASACPTRWFYSVFKRNLRHWMLACLNLHQPICTMFWLYSNDHTPTFTFVNRWVSKH